MAPLKPKDGSPAVLLGRQIVAGLAYPERSFSARASVEEIWAGLELAATPSGQQRVWDLHQSGFPSTPALRRFAAYVNQARSFYMASLGMDVLSRPLAAYYAVLNLSKAWLTLQDPATTSGKLRHGAFDAYKAKSKYSFSQEQFQAQKDGVFSSISARSGQGYSYTNQKRTISELAPFLVESHQDYESSINKSPNVLPLRSLEVLRGTESSGGKDVGALWMRAQIDRGLLASREIAISKLPSEAYHFGQIFTQKASTQEGCLTYESSPVIYGKNTRHAIPGLIAQFGDSLLHVNRGGGAERYFVVLSPKKQLLSQEAVSFVVLLHLSNMVRYRPEQVEKVATERWSWLLSTWVPRALENSLLTYSTRILQQEVRLVQ